MAPRPQFWLFKSEPETYSFAQLLKDGKTNWDHVRNFQARNFLQKAVKGDLAPKGSGAAQACCSSVDLARVAIEKLGGRSQHGQDASLTTREAGRYGPDN